MFYDKWFRSYASKESGYPLVYLSSFYGSNSSIVKSTYAHMMCYLKKKHIIIYSELCAIYKTFQKHIICALVLYVLCALKLHGSIEFPFNRKSIFHEINFFIKFIIHRIYLTNLSCATHIFLLNTKHTSFL